jgi:hypothetical protein
MPHTSDGFRVDAQRRPWGRVEGGGCGAGGGGGGLGGGGGAPRKVGTGDENQVAHYALLPLPYPRQNNHAKAFRYMDHLVAMETPRNEALVAGAGAGADTGAGASGGALADRSLRSLRLSRLVPGR